ncbi:MAG: prolyl oligopeptidase family serine peptidase [Halobacteriales archaeon]
MSVPDIERYLNIRSAHSASFSADGERLSFLTDITGVPQLWTMDGPGVWPEQISFYDERVTFGSWSPERPELIFGMDEGGNERAQLFRLDAEGETVTPLTQMPDAKHRWGGWNSDGTAFAFASNRRDEAVFDIYTQDRDETGDDAELVHEGDGWLSVGGWSPDDDRLLVHEAYSNFDQDVYVLDIDTGDLTHVTPHEGDVRYGSVQWAPDGEALYLTTDEGTDTTYLARLELDDLKRQTVESGGGWNVDGVSIDEDTGRIVYSRNLDGYTELTVGELTDELTISTYPSPVLPDGVYGGVDFDPDGERFAITVTGATRNANVYVIDIESGEVERWTRAATAGIPRETFRTAEIVRYGSFDDREIPAYLSVPAGDEGEERRPVIVDIHGGPESQRRPSFNPVKQYFLANGYAVFEPNVRGSTGYGKAYSRLDDVRNRMDSVNDIKAGVEWLGTNDRIDPDRIVAMGGSYGGFMVLASLTEYPELWAAGIDIVGIANFVTFLENTGSWRRELREAEYGSLEEDREFLEEISPINNIDRIRAPLMVLHGANDPRVPVGEAEQIVEKASEHVPVEKVIFDDEGHGFSKLENRIEAYRRIVGFLDEHV